MAVNSLTEAQRRTFLSVVREPLVPEPADRDVPASLLRACYYDSTLQKYFGRRPWSRSRHLAASDVGLPQRHHQVRRLCYVGASDKCHVPGTTPTPQATSARAPSKEARDSYRLERPPLRPRQQRPRSSPRPFAPGRHQSADMLVPLRSDPPPAATGGDRLRLCRAKLLARHPVGTDREWLIRLTDPFLRSRHGIRPGSLNASS